MLNVLSLFDGISCGQLALQRLGFKVNKYYASEIDKSAIQITQKNFPNTIQLGDVREIQASKLSKIDLLIGGSPCQSFSNAGNNKGFNGESGLFYEYIRLLKQAKPTFFLLENVKMKKEWSDIISREIGVQPILINSNLVSAQNRERLYWTNIPKIEQPKDKKIFITDITENEQKVNCTYWLKAKNTFLLYRKINFDNAPKLCAIDVYNKKFKIDNKVPTLTLPHHNSLRLLQNGRFRKFTPNECEELQNIPLDYTKGITDTERYKLLGDGWTIEIISHILSHIPFKEKRKRGRHSSH